MYFIVMYPGDVIALFIYSFLLCLSSSNARSVDKVFLIFDSVSHEA